MTNIQQPPNLVNPEAIYRAAIGKWGIFAQLDMAIEEAAELTQALMHLRRRRCTEADVANEIADMTIMCGQLRLIFGAEVVDAKIQEKLARLEGRLAA
jgi:NTP pyrophosphatase (non-canonical NTP hydrolase)